MVVSNISVDLVDRKKALSIITDSLSASAPLAVVSANLHHIHEFADDESWICRPAAEPVSEFAEGMRWLTLLDGAPLVRKADALTGRPWAKLSGSDLIDEVIEAAAVCGARLGFLGGTAETHRSLLERVGQRHPAVCIAGTWAPTRSEVIDPAASSRIAATMPGDIRSNSAD